MKQSTRDTVQVILGIILAGLGVAFIFALAGCGPLPTAPAPCRYFYNQTDSLYVEPGHRLGAVVITQHCLKQ